MYGGYCTYIRGYFLIYVIIDNERDVLIRFCINFYKFPLFFLKKIKDKRSINNSSYSILRVRYLLKSSRAAKCKIFNLYFSNYRNRFYTVYKNQ